MADHLQDRWAVVERLYQDAIDLDPAERAAYLERATPGDDDLRRDVQALLEFTPGAEPFLERPALVHAAEALAASRGALIGTRLSGYQMVALLGAGGMGEVYRARDVRLGREAAIKVIDPVIASDPMYRQRFEEEARAASTLNHPNIVTIYGAGEEDDVTFIAMELVEGCTLRDRMARGRVTVGEALDLVIPMASALVAAHERGIVHRDLKPENVMVAHDGQVKILDFGVATQLDPSHAATSAAGVAEPDVTRVATQAGAIVGTIGYMSPEQAAGQPATAASDQFALGVIAHELLTGRSAAIRDGDVDPIGRVSPAVPPRLRRIVDRCLARRPQDRFERTRDLETALRAIGDRERARGVPRLTRRRLLGLGAATAVAVAAGVSTWRLWPVTALAVLPFASAGGREETDYLAIGITESLIWRLRQLPIDVKPFSLVAHFEELPRDARAIGRQIGASQVLSGTVDARDGRLVVTAELLDVGAGTSLWQSSFDRADTDIFALWDQIATAVVDDGLRLRLTRDERLHLLSRPTNDVEAYDDFLRARPLQMSGSATDYLTARDLLARAVARDRKFAEAWVALAGTYWTSALDNFIPPTEAWPHVEQSLVQAAAINPRLPDLSFGRAIKAFFGDWAWAAAEREWHTASTLPDGDIQPELLLSYALGRWAMNDAAGALAIVRRARTIDPISPIFALSEASYLTRLGRWDEAASLYRSVSATDPDAPTPYFGLADVRHAQGRIAEAIAARVTAHELEGDDRNPVMREAMTAARGPDGWRQLEQTAITELELPRLARRQASGDYTSPLDLARAHARLGERDRALTHLAEALDDRSPALVFLNVDSAWDGLRADQQFEALVARVGLPGSTGRLVSSAIRMAHPSSWRRT